MNQSLETPHATDERAIAGQPGGPHLPPVAALRRLGRLRSRLEKLGAVLIARCRDSVAARQLGFVPARGLPAALEMARGRAGGEARIGFLLSPPYFPIRVMPG